LRKWRSERAAPCCQGVDTEFDKWHKARHFPEALFRFATSDEISRGLIRQAKLPAEQSAEIAAVLKLEPFERFVYVMSVRERYSDQRCSVLLGCARVEVSAARIRALQQIGNAMEFRNGKSANGSSVRPASHDARRSLLQLSVTPCLATSA
jgi:hypothetical protein